MMDLSDGLAEDLPRLCAESGLAARVFADRIPIDSSCTTLAGRLGLDPLSLAASGGEDYELLFTCPHDAVDEITAAVSARTGTVVCVVGETSPGKGVVLVDAEGKAHEFARGFDHFAAPDGCADDHGP
jgi:thiamine-monophosphate kinase